MLFHVSLGDLTKAAGMSYEHTDLICFLSHTICILKERERDDSSARTAQLKRWYFGYRVFQKIFLPCYAQISPALSHLSAYRRPYCLATVPLTRSPRKAPAARQPPDRERGDKGAGYVQDSAALESGGRPACSRAAQRGFCRKSGG